MKKITPQQAVQLVLDKKYGGNQSAMAKALQEAGFPKTRQQHIHNWINRDCKISAFYAVAIERLSDGLVTAKQINSEA